MSGAFLAVSFRPPPQGPEPARGAAALDRLRCDLVGPGRDRWGTPGPTATTLLTWQRDEPLGTTVQLGEERAWMNIGASAPTSHPADPAETVGVFSTVVADQRGATAWCDDMGYGTVFTWSGRNATAVSTRPELLAELARELGEPPTKDPSIAAEMGHLGWLSPERTGWAEITALRAGESARIAGGRLEITSDPATAHWTAAPEHRRSSAIVDEAAERLVDNVRTVTALDVPIKVDLTAGRDSRLVVAALVAAGALERIELQTVGDEDLQDVRVAIELAEHLGVPHRWGFFYPTSDDPFGTRFERHVASTAGVSNVMKGLRESLGTEHHLRVAGQMGEVIRGWPTPVTRDEPSREVVPAIARAFQAGRVELLRPDALADARGRFRREIVRHDDGSLPGWFAAHRYYAEVRLRARMTRVGDFVPEVRAYPLYSRGLTGAAMGWLWQEPDVDLADVLIERLAPGLDAAIENPPATVPANLTAAPKAEPSLMQVAMAAQAETRQAFFADVADRNSAAWGWLDRSAYRAAVHDFADLSGPQKRLVHGAAGAVIWLEDQAGREPQSE